jgi:hypothetical protein
MQFSFYAMLWVYFLSLWSSVISLGSTLLCSPWFHVYLAPTVAFALLGAVYGYDKYQRTSVTRTPMRNKYFYLTILYNWFLEFASLLYFVMSNALSAGLTSFFFPLILPYALMTSKPWWATEYFQAKTVPFEGKVTIVTEESRIGQAWLGKSSSESDNDCRRRTRSMTRQNK